MSKEKSSLPPLPSLVLQHRARRCGLWLLDSIANGHRIDESAEEYLGALRDFRRAALAEIRMLKIKE